MSFTLAVCELRTQIVAVWRVPGTSVAWFDTLASKSQPPLVDETVCPRPKLPVRASDDVRLTLPPQALLGVPVDSNPGLGTRLVPSGGAVVVVVTGGVVVVVAGRVVVVDGGRVVVVVDGGRVVVV